MKDRNLSLLDYLDELQTEFFISEIRSRFYYNPSDKRYYKRVASHKKDKILNISTQNNIKCIFNNDKLFEEYKSKVYPKSGLPNFKHTNNMFKLTKKDIQNYYSIDSDVKCIFEDEELLGKIVKTTESFKKILVKIRGTAEERYFSSENITRIL